MALGLTLGFCVAGDERGSRLARRVWRSLSIGGWFRGVLPHEAHEDVAVR